MKKILLFNPKATTFHYRIPNSILSVAASIEGKFEWVFVDGNRETDPWSKIESVLNSGEFSVFASTVMPGPQLKQAIPFSKKIKTQFPEITIVWGGYFASNQYKTVLESGFVDFVVNGPGDVAFPQLLDCLKTKSDFSGIKNLIFLKDQKIVVSPKDQLADQDSLPILPYKKLDSFYPIDGYLWKTYLGSKTIAYHSSIGCPFSCSFCAVVPIYEAGWKGKSADLIYHDIKFLIEEYGGNAVEFHDNNFFVSEKRTVEFSKLIAKEKIGWWGEGRIDTIDKYSDESLQIMADSGCKMIFFGAETGNDEILKQMNKGGTQTGKKIREFAARMRKFNIVPEYSFVLGTPGNSDEEVWKQIEFDIRFIKEIKEINPDTEIIIYIYSPVPQEGSELFEAVKSAGFKFPEHLEDWLNPHWENFDLRKNPLTPWLKPSMVDRIKNFETVLNGYYPTKSDLKLSGFQKKAITALSSWRYKLNFFHFPYELRFLQSRWLKYRKPETEGF